MHEDWNTNKKNGEKENLLKLWIIQLKTSKCCDIINKKINSFIFLLFREN